MQPLFTYKEELDKASFKNFALNEHILMENAGGNLARFIVKKIKKHIPTQSRVIFLCGGGNNGADGLVAARILKSLNPQLNITIFMLHNPKSHLCKAHYHIIERLNYDALTKGAKVEFHLEMLKIFQNTTSQDSKIGYAINNALESFLSFKPNDILLDCIFGSGFDNTTRTLQHYPYYRELQRYFKDSRALKIACDVPSGLSNVLGHKGDIEDILGSVDYTVCMGVANVSLFDSRIKDFIGKVKILPLGISQKSYCGYPESDNVSQECSTAFLLLEKKDMRLPLRTLRHSNKGSYGTAFIIAGETFGASLLSAKAALNFGLGKVCIYEGFLNKREPLQKDCEMIYTCNLPKSTMNRATDSYTNNATSYAFGIGMGLGYDELQYHKLFTWLYSLCNLPFCKDNKTFDDASDSLLESYRNVAIKTSIPFVFDADILYRKELIFILPFLQQVVLTPHPKELLALIQNMQLKHLSAYSSIDSVLRNMPHIAQGLSQSFPHVVFLLKDSNTIIAHNHRIYINIHGRANLAKGGSGDILSGMIVSLLGQGYSSLDAALQASLAHAVASQKALRFYDSYALTPKKLLKIITKLS